jgi:hypothetical protein
VGMLFLFSPANVTMTSENRNNMPTIAGVPRDIKLSNRYWSF